MFVNIINFNENNKQTNKQTNIRFFIFYLLSILRTFSSFVVWFEIFIFYWRINFYSVKSNLKTLINKMQIDDERICVVIESKNIWKWLKKNKIYFKKYKLNYLSFILCYSKISTQLSSSKLSFYYYVKLKWNLIINIKY